LEAIYNKNIIGDWRDYNKGRLRWAGHAMRSIKPLLSAVMEQNLERKIPWVK